MAIKTYWKELEYRFWYWLLKLSRRHIQHVDNPYLTDLSRKMVTERYSAIGPTTGRNLRRRY